MESLESFGAPSPDPSQTEAYEATSIYNRIDRYSSYEKWRAVQSKELKLVSSSGRGERAYHRNFEMQYGKGRWKRLLNALIIKDARVVALLNGLCGKSMDGVEQIVRGNTVSSRDIFRINLSDSLICIAAPYNPCEQGLGTKKLFAPPQPVENINLLPYYILDLASVIVTSVFDFGQDLPRPLRVLDMTAAPGGKSIALCNVLFSQSASLTKPPPKHVLVCNEKDPIRFRRLEACLESYIPKEIFSSEQVVLVNKDGRKLAANAENNPLIGSFDYILLDAPCSSDRHVLCSAERKKLLSEWSMGQVDQAWSLQLELLSSAIKLANSHARIVYSTCALAYEENDLVVQKAVDHFNHQFSSPRLQVRTVDVIQEGRVPLGLGERTKHGLLILPDYQDQGWGPIFISCLQKYSA